MLDAGFAGRKQIIKKKFLLCFDGAIEILIYPPHLGEILGQEFQL